MNRYVFTVTNLGGEIPIIATSMENATKEVEKIIGKRYPDNDNPIKLVFVITVDWDIVIAD